ncbi:MAG: hypothetical protein ABIG69_06305 [Bacteroidota bacterium]
MKLKIKFFIVFLSGIIICSCDENPVSDTTLYESEKYKVYSDIINSEFTQGLIFIIDSTASGYWIINENPSYLPDTIQTIFPALKPETLAMYKYLNETRTIIENKFNLLIDYEIISTNETIDSLNYVIIDLTNAAFNKLYTQSLVYIGFIERFGGFGRFLYLEKKEDNWEVKGSKYVWSLK